MSAVNELVITPEFVTNMIAVDLADETTSTTADKAKLNGIEAGAQVNTVTRVAGKTGVVELNAGDIGYDGSTAYDTGTVGEKLSDLNRQISDLETDIDYLQLENRTIVNIDSAGNRISVSTPNATNNNTRHLLCWFSVTGGAYDNFPVISVEVSAYSQNGGVLYAQSPAPGNIAVPNGWKNSGIDVVVDVKLIANIAIATIYMTNKSTQSTAIIMQQVSFFTSEPKSLRTCILWHYMTASSANIYIVPDNTGAWSAVAFG